MKLCELIIVCLACVLPVYLLADNVNGDEIAKTGLGVTVTGIVGAYKVWKGKLDV